MRQFSIIFLLILSACSAPPKPIEEAEKTHPNEHRMEAPLTEEMPDSGILHGVDPEQIITDDWSDDGDIELEIKEK